MTAGPILLGAFGLAFLAAIVFSLYWAISSEIVWASRVRRLLEQDGFNVQHMERRWFTRGPFPDLRLPGMKFQKAWLVRIAGRDRELRPRSGWPRWKRRWPWERADTWAVRWDDVPWSGQWDGPDAQKKGLSSRVFLPLVHGVSALGAIAGIFLVVQYIKDHREAEADRNRGQIDAVLATSSGTPARPDTYELRCRGGYRGAFQIETVSTRTDPARQDPVVLMSLQFIPSPTAAGADGSGLMPGSCAWLDRSLHASEPRVIRFEAAGVRTSDSSAPIRPAPGALPDDALLGDATRYWSFQVFNTNTGFLQATGEWK
jgi:hypothetical protein